MRWTVLLAAAGLALLLAACGGDDPVQPVTQGETLFTADFSAPGGWEEGTLPPGDADPQSVLAIEDGRYRIEHESVRSASFVWGAGGPPAEDVIVEVRAEQLSEDDDNLYGVGCRLLTAEDGTVTGYLLLISGDGHYGIAELSRGSLDFALDWHQATVIRQGQAGNILRVVCVDDYLALYANGEFLGAVEHDAYRRPGEVALVAGVTEGGRVSVAFDELIAYEGALERVENDE